MLELPRHSVVQPVTPDGTVNFIFSDPDKNWWELTANG